MSDVEKDSTLMDSASTGTSEIEAVPGGSSEEKRVGAGRTSYSPQLDIVELREQLLAEREANLAHVRALSARYVELQANLKTIQDERRRPSEREVALRKSADSLYAKLVETRGLLVAERNAAREKLVQTRSREAELKALLAERRSAWQADKEVFKNKIAVLERRLGQFTALVATQKQNPAKPKPRAGAAANATGAAASAVDPKAQDNGTDGST